jgi:hypothetical protein
MLELVIAACLIDAPSQCRDVYLNFEADNATPMQCAFYGQIEMAKWLGEHPRYRITKWRCGPAGQTAKL